jgi:hypothetical protein
MSHPKPRSTMASSVELGTAFGDWLIWAAQQADRIDPLKGTPPSLIDSKLIPH